MRKFSQFFFIIVFSLFCFLSIPAQDAREELEVLNIEIPVRVMYKGKPVDNLKRSDFSLFENGKKININGFNLIKKKISDDHEAVKREGKGEKRRLFVLAFSITNFNRLYEKGVKYLFDHILKKNDSLIIMINNVMLTYNDLINKEYIYKKIVSSLKEEGRKARSNLLGIFRSVELGIRMLKTELGFSRESNNLQIVESEMHNKHILLFLRSYKSAWDDFKGRFLFSDLAPYYNLSEFLKKRDGEKWAVNFYQMEKFPMLDPMTEIYRKIVTGAGIIGRRIIKQIEKEFDAEKGFPADEVGKMFTSSGVRFDMVLVPSRVESNTSGIISGDVSTSIENTLRKIADLTGGGKTLSSNIEKVFSDMVKREDIVYMLTYEPSDSAKRGKIRIKLQNKKYKIIYDRNRRAGFISRYIGKNRVEQRIVKIGDVRFSNRILEVKVEDLMNNKTIKLAKGNLTVNVVLFNGENNKFHYFKKENVKTDKGAAEVSFDMNQIVKGKWDIMIDVQDLVSGKSAFEYIQVKSGKKRRDTGINSGGEKMPDVLPDNSDGKDYLNEKLLKNILSGSAVYCSRLRNSAFHFFCTESISSIGDDVETGSPGSRRIFRRKFSDKYKFDYQLINDSSGVREQRREISKNIKSNPEDIHNLVISFLSEKPVFAPVMILGKKGQNEFDFTFSGIHKKNGRKFARIKATPKKPKNFFFTTAWIDIYVKDYSVRKIRVIPRYIKGYDSLMRRTFHFRTRLFLDCVIDFGQSYNGLWFPSNIVISEKYKGGRFVTQNMGTTGWERSRTEFRYTDYRFFNVDMDIKN